MPDVLQKTDHSPEGWICTIRAPRNTGHLLMTHLPAAAISGGLLLASWLGSFFTALPTTCTWLRLTHTPCPLCGSTRSFAAMASGHPATAFQNSPFAALLFIVVVVVFLWNIAGLMTRRCITRGRALRLKTPRVRWTTAAVVLGLLFANWVYRLAAGLK